MDKLDQSQSVTTRTSNTVPLHTDSAAHTVYKLRIGQQLGNYHVVRLLAEGGFAEVYLGEHIHLGTYAAIKVLKARLTSNDLQTFREEARTIARLRHTHIISILDFDVQNEMPFLVMDYAPHGTLRQRHPKGTILPPTTALPYLAQVAEGLQYAHNQRLIHRDVKPENMLLGWNNEILLSDFGVAVMLQTSHSEQAHEVIGTITYMSPEQFTGFALPASDQYSLGVVAYEWLCGQSPFQGSLTEIARQHVHTLPPALRNYNPHLSPELEQVILRALAKNPAQRYPGVQAFVKAFATACPQQPILLSDSDVFEINHNETLLSTPNQDATVHVSLSQAVFASQPKKHITRRSVLLGISSIAGIGITAGGIAQLIRTNPRLLSQFLQGAPLKTTPRPTATSTPTPSKTGALLQIYHGHSDVVTSVAWSPLSQNYIASASMDRTAHAWTSTNGVDIRNYTSHTSAVNAIAWAPHGHYIATASNDSTVQIWGALPDVQAEAAIIYNNHQDAVNAVTWSPDGVYIASGSSDTTVRVWTPLDGNDVATYTGHSAPVRAVAWSPAVVGGQLIASAGSDGTVQVWQLTTTTRRHNQIQASVNFQGHNNTVNAVAWSPNGKYIASASADMTVQVWSSSSGQNPLIYKGHSASVNAVAWAPDGNKIASASDDGTIRIWDPTTGNNIFTYTGHSLTTTNPIYGVQWSLDGVYIASASADKTVQIWHS